MGKQEKYKVKKPLVYSSAFQHPDLLINNVKILALPTTTTSLSRNDDGGAKGGMLETFNRRTKGRLDVATVACYQPASS